jgi:hypothetical protein
VIQQVRFPPFPSLLLPCVLAVTTSACGGSNGNEPVSVGKSVVIYQSSGTVDSQPQALFAAAGVEVASVKCYPKENIGPDIITGDEATVVLYVYQVRARDLDTAAMLGFTADFSVRGFSQNERACPTGEDAPAIPG